MANQKPVEIDIKRMEQKIPQLITRGALELDRYQYRLSQFKKKEPQKWNQHRENLARTLANLKVDVDNSFQKSS